MNRAEIRDFYINRAEKFQSELTSLKRRQLIISMLRLFVFIAGGSLSGLALTYTTATGILSLLATIIIFLFLVKRFLIFSRNITLTANLLKINKDEIDAIGGDYSGFDNGSGLGPADHDFAGDIDLFGEGSLFAYLNRTVTGPGRRLLAEILLFPHIGPEIISARQEAIRELSGMPGWRQEFAAYGFDRMLEEAEIKSLAEWLNEKESAFGSNIPRLAAYIMPLATIGVLSAVVSGILPFMVFVLLFILNLFLEGFFIRRISRIHELVSRKHEFLSSVENLVRSIDSRSFLAPLLVNIKEKICSDSGAVATRISELNSITKAFDMRLNMIVGIILNGLLLWDFHCVLRLWKWKESAACQLPGWLNLLGEIDELNSFANFAFNNPEYAYPVPVVGRPVIEASEMGHPLLPAATRVSNDFSIDREGTVYIITGANMAGKSTFLRTVAVNLLLAMAGAPVCAMSMKFKPVKLFTSMRTTDSLSKNESYFYAELKRLRILKEKLEKGGDILFILDEILKGTNSTDKSTGSKIYLRRLINLGATGLIATHDISLGEMESEFPGTVVNKCFEIEIDEERISFDYRLRNGITRKMNASLLMKQMGIA